MDTKRLFGTSGIRGVAAKDLTPDFCRHIGVAIGTRLSSASTVCVATDARMSRDAIKEAVCKGLLSCSINVADLGILPTPALASLTRELDFAAGIMVTASHNPAEFNGIKLFTDNSLGYSRDQEEEIEKIFLGKQFRRGKKGTLTQAGGMKERYLSFIESRLVAAGPKRQADTASPDDEGSSGEGRLVAVRPKRQADAGGPDDEGSSGEDRLFAAGPKRQADTAGPDDERSSGEDRLFSTGRKRQPGPDDADGDLGSGEERLSSRGPKRQADAAGPDYEGGSGEDRLSSRGPKRQPDAGGPDYEGSSGEGSRFSTGRKRQPGPDDADGDLGSGEERLSSRGPKRQADTAGPDCEGNSREGSLFSTGPNRRPDAGDPDYKGNSGEGKLFSTARKRQPGPGDADGDLGSGEGRPLVAGPNRRPDAGGADYEDGSGEDRLFAAEPKRQADTAGPDDEPGSGEGRLSLPWTNRHLKVVVDPGNGAASGFASDIFARMGLQVLAVNDEPDGLFPGRGPEPKADTLQGTIDFLRQNNADLAVCFDGDADRVVFCDREGFLGFNEPIAFMSRLAIKKTGRKKIATTVETGTLLDLAVKDLGGEVVRGRVGDVAVAHLAREINAALGVEQVGVYIFPEVGYYPDSIFASLFLLSHLSDGGEIRRFFQSLPRLFFEKEKVPCADALKESVMARVKEQAHLFATDRMNMLDGVRLDFPDSWVLIRASGTEPAIRIIAESASQARTAELLDKGRKLVESS